MNNQSPQQNESDTHSLSPQYLIGFIYGAEIMKKHMEMMSSPPQLPASLVPTAGFSYSMASTDSQSPPNSVDLFTNSLNSSADQSKSTVNLEDIQLSHSPIECLIGSNAPRTTKLKSCSHCEINQSCCWRKVRSETGMMCNACFVYERKYRKSRPLSAIKKHNKMNEFN
ncbi:hypothetical protein CRE_20044 [Caenorhabditis remanei]|uniref:GATA-type domain-containing protein n=1 Tax=Caenorhabditis remanei TaxID=31234 RepID=E3NHG3_CAERE|nr:hypothetical protein CRE_20044 [Caenorhabditis remanei]